MTRLLFVPNPHVRLDRAWAAPYVPLELLSAMAVAERAGAEPVLFDVNRLVRFGRLQVDARLWARAAALLAEAEPDLVVLESWTGTLHNTLRLAACIREELPQLPIVLGGAGTSAVAVKVLEAFPAVDGVIRGELEPAVAKLAGGAPRPLPPGPGLVRRLREGIENAPLSWVDDLDDLPRPAYHLGLLQPGDTLPVETGRGCAQGCSFCALAGHWLQRYRPKSVRRVVNEMLWLAARFPGSTFDLTQDTVFFTQARRAAELAAALEGRGLRWTCHARVDRLPAEVVSALARAGCCGLLLGVETGCPALQLRVGKRLDLSELTPALDRATRAGIEVRTTFVVGFPDEDQNAVARTVEAVMQAREAGAADAAVHLLRAYPGSAIHAAWGDQLEFEPVVCTAAPDDETSRRWIREHPDILSASFRVPQGTPRAQLLGTWVALAAFGDALHVLWRRGENVAQLLQGLALDGRITSWTNAIGCIATQLAAAPLARCNIDRGAWRDLLSYQRALMEVSAAETPDPTAAEAPLLEAVVRQPADVTARVMVPWRLLRLRTPLERLVGGDLTSAERIGRQWVLVAKVSDRGAASFYTQRAASLETFILDDVAAAAFPRLDGRASVATVGREVAIRLGRRTPPTVRACAELVQEMARSHALQLEVIAAEIRHCPALGRSPRSARPAPSFEIPKDSAEIEERAELGGGVEL